MQIINLKSKLFIAQVLLFGVFIIVSTDALPLLRILFVWESTFLFWTSRAKRLFGRALCHCIRAVLNASRVLLRPFLFHRDDSSYYSELWP